MSVTYNHLIFNGTLILLYSGLGKDVLLSSRGPSLLIGTSRLFTRQVDPLCPILLPHTPGRSRHPLLIPLRKREFVVFHEDRSWTLTRPPTDTGTREDLLEKMMETRSPPKRISTLVDGAGRHSTLLKHGVRPEPVDTGEGQTCAPPDQRLFVSLNGL